MNCRVKFEVEVEMSVEFHISNARHTKLLHCDVAIVNLLNEYMLSRMYHFVVFESFIEVLSFCVVVCHDREHVV